MQALILAAGMGTRLNQYTATVPKCMVPVNGKPMIESSLEALISAGIRHIIIGLGYKGDVLKKFITDTFTPQRLNGTLIEYAENPVYDTTNNIYSLYLARDFFAGDDTILLESDLVYDKSIIARLIDDTASNVAVVSRFEPWMDGTCTLLDENNVITSFIDKKHFDWNKTDQYFKTVNIYKFSKDFIVNSYLPFLESYQRVFGKNEYYETVLSIFAFLTPGQLKGLPVSGDLWYEIDDPADLNIAENRTAEQKKRRELMEERRGGSWRFPGLIDFTNSANPFFPGKKLLSELSSNLPFYLTQKPSGIKQQSMLAAKIFKLDPQYVLVVPSNFCKSVKELENPLLFSKERISGEKKMVIDETYIPFSDDGTKDSLLTNTVLKKYPNVTVLVSLGERFGLPGLSSVLIATSNAVQLESYSKKLTAVNLSSTDEYFLQILEKYKKEYTASFTKTADERRRIIREISEIPAVSSCESLSNRIVCTFNKNISSQTIADRLLAEDKMFVSAVSDSAICFSVHTETENTALIAALKSFL